MTLAVVGLAACGLLMALIDGPASGPVAAVFPPWWGGMRTVDAAAEGGAVLRLGLLNFVVLVMPDDQGHSIQDLRCKKRDELGRGIG